MPTSLFDALPKDIWPNTMDFLGGRELTALTVVNKSLYNLIYCEDEKRTQEVRAKQLEAYFPEAFYQTLGVVDKDNLTQAYQKKSIADIAKMNRLSLIASSSQMNTFHILKTGDLTKIQAQVNSVLKKWFSTPNNQIIELYELLRLEKKTILHFLRNQKNQPVLDYLYDTIIIPLPKKPALTEQFNMALACNQPLDKIKKLFDDTSSSEQMNALAFALLRTTIRYDRTDVLTWLQNEELNLQVVNEKGQNGLHIAARYNSTATAQALLTASVEHDIKAQHVVHKSVLETKHFRSMGAVISFRVPKSKPAALITGETPLLIAAQHNNLAMVKLLVDKGADVNARTNETAHTPFLYACSHPQGFNVARYLIEKDANIDAETTAGCTALHLAAKSGAAKLVEWLLSLKKIPIERWDNAKCAALSYAHNEATARLLITAANTLPEEAQKNYFAGVWHDIIINANLPAVQALLALKSPINKDAALYLATAHYSMGVLTPNQCDILKTLVTAGADPMVQFSGRTALGCANSHVKSIIQAPTPITRWFRETFKPVVDKQPEIPSNKTSLLKPFK